MPMVMIEPAVALPFSSGAGAGDHSAHRFSHAGGFSIPWNRFRRSSDGCFARRKNLVKSGVRASAEQSGLGSEPIGKNVKPQYHPSEAIAESALQENGDASLTPAETTRTVIELNSKATLMFSSLANGEVPENLFWPGLHYVTDEHGNIYFKVNSDEDIMQSLTSENNFVQVLIGLDSTELSGSSEIDFGIEEIGDEDSDFDDEDDEDDDEEDESEDGINEEDWVSILENEEDEEDSDESIGDWAKLETMRSSHPMYFARKLAEVAADNPIDWMDHPPAGLVIQGLLRPAFIEEHSGIPKHIADQLSNADINQTRKIAKEKVKEISVLNGHSCKSGSPKDGSAQAEGLESDEDLRSETSFYKLEMINIQLISAHGHQTTVQIGDFKAARPDAIAHSAAKIISRLKAGGERASQALKSLCWRCKGIKVEEATIIGVDTLGFDLKVCSGTQVQTLRFAFSTRATSEYSAEIQLNDLLFPRIHPIPAKGETSSPKEMLT